MIRCIHGLSILLALRLLGIPLTAEGQQPAHVYRSGRPLSTGRLLPASNA